MKKDELIDGLELLLQEAEAVRRKINQELDGLMEGIERLLPEEPLQVDRDYIAEVREICKKKAREGMKNSRKKRKRSK